MSENTSTETAAPAAARTHYGVMTDYEYTATHKRERITVWSAPFASVYEGEGYSLPNGAGYMVTTYNGDKVRVACPAPRNETNYNVVDKAIAAALNAHHNARGAVRMGQ